MNNNLKKNASGCYDQVAYEAIVNTENDERFHKFLSTIFAICELSGFHIEERLVVRDKKTGKVWR